MTQMQLARQGLITEAMRQVAHQEHCEPEFIRASVAGGSIVIPRNKHHDFMARGVGKGIRTKINANFGTSAEHCNLEEEMQKLAMAVQFGVDSIMDLSTGGNLLTIREQIISHSPVMVGTVPVYAVMTNLLKEGLDLMTMDAEMLFREIEIQAEAGVDFMTVHAGICRKSVAFMEGTDRVLGVVSRGGSFMLQWMLHHGCENPLYEQYDRLLEIAETWDVTLSLGDGFRPGAIADASDRMQIAELLVLGELVDRARKRGVQVMVEGPGHVPLPQIRMNVELQKVICKNAPFYVLGPLPTDFASGYDHITGAIGAAIAGAYGADFLCYLTPAEHLCLPTVDDVKQGVIASRIAAHSADIAKGITGADFNDVCISRARSDFDWEIIYRLSVDPETARQRKSLSEAGDQDHCTMCGELCAVKMNRRNIQS